MRAAAPPSDPERKCHRAAAPALPEGWGQRPESPLLLGTAQLGTVPLAQPRGSVHHGMSIPGPLPVTLLPEEDKRKSLWLLVSNKIKSSYKTVETRHMKDLVLRIYKSA